MKRFATLTLAVSLFATAAFAATDGAWTASTEDKQPDRFYMNITRGRTHNMGTTFKVSDFTDNGVAFHGAYWHNDFGTPRSHGCVNLPVSFAKWLYDWTPLGTRVWVHE